MSNIEHLLENAIDEIQRGRTIDDFTIQWHNNRMLDCVNASAAEIWVMAQYVVFRYER